MKEVGISELRRRFSELVERATKGEQFGITKHGVLLALLTPATAIEMALDQIVAPGRTPKRRPRVATKRRG